MDKKEIIEEKNICEKCGTENNLKSKFCINCGNPLDKDKEQIGGIIVDDNGQEVKEEQKVNNQHDVSIKKIVLLVILFIFTMALGVSRGNILGIAVVMFGWLIFLSTNKDPDTAGCFKGCLIAIVSFLILFGICMASLMGTHY